MEGKSGSGDHLFQTMREIFWQLRLSDISSVDGLYSLFCLCDIVVTISNLNISSGGDIVEISKCVGNVSNVGTLLNYNGSWSDSLDEDAYYRKKLQEIRSYQLCRRNDLSLSWTSEDFSQYLEEKSNSCIFQMLQMYHTIF